VFTSIDHPAKIVSYGERNLVPEKRYPIAREYPETKVVFAIEHSSDLISQLISNRTSHSNLF
jgi:hypothetical protein